jgi:HTH-type transcriptional regulator / antitoxin HigA
MTVKPIRSDADYRAALSRIESLMGATEGSREADDLEVLAALVERYEQKADPIDPPSAVEAIRFRMEQLGLTPRDLEPFIGTRARVSEVLGGIRPLSMDMVRALHRHLGIPSDALIRQSGAPQRAADIPDLSKAAARQLVDWGLLLPRETIQGFLDRAFGEAPARALWRRTRTMRTNAKTDPVALSAWCAGAAMRATAVKVKVRFDATRLDGPAFRSFAKLSVREDGPQRAMAMLVTYGIAPVVLPHLPGTHLDGAALRRADGVPVVALTLRRDRVDNFWFTLLHEMAHVARHLSAEDSAILDDLEVGSEDVIEAEADKLAEQALVPEGFWSGPATGQYASIAEIADLAERAEINPAIVAGRWQREHRDFRKFARLLGHGTIRQRFPEFVSASSP